jgi:hypothetical protein
LGGCFLLVFSSDIEQWFLMEPAKAALREKLDLTLSSTDIVSTCNTADRGQRRPRQSCPRRCSPVRSRRRDPGRRGQQLVSCFHSAAPHTTQNLLSRSCVCRVAWGWHQTGFARWLQLAPRPCWEWLLTVGPRPAPCWFTGAFPLMETLRQERATHPHRPPHLCHHFCQQPLTGTRHMAQPKVKDSTSYEGLRNSVCHERACQQRGAMGQQHRVGKGSHVRRTSHPV